MKGLTERQKQVLTFLEAFQSENGFCPSLREIGAHFGYSQKAASDHINAMRAKGYIAESPRKSRSFTILRDDQGMGYHGVVAVPVVGHIAAGQPIMALENTDGIIRVDRTLLKKEAVYFALRVTGDSMIGAGIMDGDTVVIEKCATANNNDIVAAWVDDSVTLKRFFREQGRVRLQAENKKYPPIFTKSARIEGKLACVMRTCVVNADFGAAA